MGRTIAYALIAAEHTPDLTLSVIDSYGTFGIIFMPVFFAAACLRLILACALRRADIIHIHMSQRGSALRKSILLLLAKACGARVVLHLHGSRFGDFFDGLPTWLRRLMVWVMAQADRVIVIARVWERYAAEIGLPRQQVILIHNGVPDRGPRHERAAHQHPVRLLALGELGVRKGTDDILEALNNPALRDQGWRAVLAGNGPVTDYRDRVATAGLSDRIEIPGWVDTATVGQLFNEADILLLPSYHEGLPLAILEALAAGVAVIATAVGGIPDAVINGETGLIVPSGDPAALAQAISRLIADPDLRRELARNGRRHFVNTFDLNITFSHLTAVYRSLCPTLNYSPS